jgi:hypothetical protein|tara:strand:- start:647 stop:1306 length:660 start_codon:yes stop_codon:yes gene_type:complete
MAFKYRQVYFEDGDIIDARDWNRNISEFADELNGYLDRDNLPEDQFTYEHVASNGFNEFYSNLSDTTAEHRTIDGNLTTWQSESDAGVGLGDVTFASDTDGLLVVEWSGSWIWQGTSSDFDWIPLSAARASSTGVSPYNNVLEHYVKYRLVVDGIVVSSSPRSVWTRAYDSAYMCAAVPLPAGNHKVGIEVRIRSKDGGPAYQDVKLIDRELICWLRKR